MKKTTDQEYFTPREIEERLRPRESEELECRLEMLLPLSWCTSGCGPRR
jgi:hypothetical protein